MFYFQSNRFFPLPEYETNDGRIKVSITGKVLDMDFARILAQNQELSLEEIILLDKVQKRKPLSELEEKHLRTRKLVEGRRPNFYFSSQLARSVKQKAKYSNIRGFEKVYYLDLILKAIREHTFLERGDVDTLLWNKLPDWMDDKQKKTKVNHLLSELRKKGKIKNLGSLAKPKWQIHNPND